MHAPARTRTDARLAQGIRANARVHAHMCACTHEHALRTAQHSKHSQHSLHTRSSSADPSRGTSRQATPEHHEARSTQRAANMRQVSSEYSEYAL